MTNICPATEFEYQGQCPVTTCPAYLKRAESGCIYQDLKGEVSLFSVGNRLRLSNTQIKKDYRRGVKILTDSAKFYHLSRQSFSVPLKTCSNCGISGDTCINKIRCNKRKEFASKQIKRIPMRVLYNPSMTMFWQIISNKELSEFFQPKTLSKAKKLLARVKVK